ncbi:MAG: ABC transporter substrate-binding protein, partial [Paracoccaceae bacterium]
PVGSPVLEPFRQGLRDLGYVEGQNIVIEWRSAEGKYDRLPALAAELVDLKVDLIVATATQASRAAKEATTTIPIVFIAVARPVRVGLVKSLARPGGNITGFSSLVPEGFAGKRLEVLKETVPGLTRLAVLVNPTNVAHPAVIQDLSVAAEKMGVTLQILEATRPDDLESAFDAATREEADALFDIGDALTFVHRRRIATLAAKHRLPANYLFRQTVEAGGLMSYGASIPDLLRRGASYVDKILKGAKPADLPVQRPTRFELYINLKTAKALGLTIPSSVLIRADKVIE